MPGLEDCIAVIWYPGVLDAWYEEDVLVHTHPRYAGNRVDVIPSKRHIKVVLKGEVLAESTSALVLCSSTRSRPASTSRARTCASTC